MNWVEAPAGKYEMLTGHEKRSRCQTEIILKCVCSELEADIAVIPIWYPMLRKGNGYPSHRCES